MLRLKDDAHTALTKPALEQVAAADRRAPRDREEQGITIERTAIKVVVVTASAF
jgi:hypothetical protein